MKKNERAHKERELHRSGQSQKKKRDPEGPNNPATGKWDILRKEKHQTDRPKGGRKKKTSKMGEGRSQFEQLAEWKKARRKIEGDV